MALTDHSIKVLSDTYEGNAANNREIDLGDDYDEVHVYLEESGATSALHLVEAYAIGPTYGVSWEYNVSNSSVHDAMAAGDTRWQGKMTGGDANKIKLGSTGNADEGTNRSGSTYRIIAKKYVNVVALPP